MRTIGCKLVREDGGSLRGEGTLSAYGSRRVIYGPEWQTVPGNGAYVAITGALFDGGDGPRLIYLECEEPTGAEAPHGVVCFRRVRVVSDCPDEITPELRGLIALDAPSLTSQQRFDMAKSTTQDWKGRFAYFTIELTAEQRFELAKDSTPTWRGWIARRHSRDLTPQQRFELAKGSPEDRDAIVSWPSY
jgi:hypothetical protein